MRGNCGVDLSTPLSVNGSPSSDATRSNGAISPQAQTPCSSSSPFSTAGAMWSSENMEAASRALSLKVPGYDGDVRPLSSVRSPYPMHGTASFTTMSRTWPGNKCLGPHAYKGSKWPKCPCRENTVVRQHWRARFSGPVDPCARPPTQR